MSSRQIRVTAIAISVRRQTQRCVNQSTSYFDLNPKMQSKNFYQVCHRRPALQFVKLRHPDMVTSISLNRISWLCSADRTTSQTCQIMAR